MDEVRMLLALAQLEVLPNYCRRSRASKKMPTNMCYFPQPVSWKVDVGVWKYVSSIDIPRNAHTVLVFLVMLHLLQLYNHVHNIKA
jgi:hypothetical protein